MSIHLSLVPLCVFPGKVVHSMVAHLDAVTCLTTDPKGTYLISGSEYHSAVLRRDVAENLRANWISLHCTPHCPSWLCSLCLRPLSAPCRPRLLGAPVDAGQQDVRAGDHGSQEEARRGHSWRGLPPLTALHCQRRRRCTCQDLCLTSLSSFWWDGVNLPWECTHSELLWHKSIKIRNCSIQFWGGTVYLLWLAPLKRELWLRRSFPEKITTKMCHHQGVWWSVVENF